MKRVLGVVMIIVGSLLTIPVGIQLVKIVLMIFSFLDAADPLAVEVTAFGVGGVVGYAIGTVLIVVGVVSLFIYGIRFAQGKSQD